LFPASAALAEWDIFFIRASRFSASGLLDRLSFQESFTGPKLRV